MKKLVLVLVAAAACGPSTAEIKASKTAEYRGDPHRILEMAEEATRDEYKIGDVDPEHLTFVTAPRFYGPEGDLESPGDQGFVQLQPGSVRVELIVEVHPMGDDAASITVTPRTFQTIAGSPKPRELGPDDPYLPPFVKGRADALSLSIYKYGQKLVIK